MRLFLFFSLLFLFGCSINKTSIRKTVIGKVDSRDKKCFEEIKKAKRDFKDRKFYFYIRPEGYIDAKATRHHSFLRELLQENGIAFSNNTDLELDYKYDDGKEVYALKTNCYSKTYNELLNLKYGMGFTQKIEKKADSLYVMRKINEIFSYPDEVDYYCIVYPNVKEFLEQKIQIQKDFFENFKFPEGFIFSNNERDFIAGSKFIINRDATVSDIIVNIEFKNYHNSKFSNYIENEITKFIKSSNWKSATSSGIMVNCHFKINFYN